MARGLGNDLGSILGDLFPAFFADYHMEDLPFSFVGTIIILDVIYPPEMLPSIPPTPC